MTDPQRTCVGCRTVRPKAELARIVRGTDGATDVDETGKKPGRGVYVCRSAACLETAVKRKALERSLKGPIPPEAVERLRAQFVL